MPLALPTDHLDTVKPTGFELIDHGLPNRVRRAVGMKTKVSDPTQKFVVGQGNRARVMDARSPIDIATLENSYQVDGPLKQAVDKHVDLIMKEGYYIDGDNPKAVEYIETRLNLLRYVRETDPVPFPIFIQNIAEDYVKYGNVFLRMERTKSMTPFPGIKTTGLEGQKSPIGAFFPINPATMTPILDKKGKITSWEQKCPAQEAMSHPIEAILHFPYKRTTGTIWGISMLAPIIDDIRLLRQCEEMVAGLIHKYLHPLYHHEVPDLVGDGQGLQEDVDDAQLRIQEMAPDGYIITPPNHKIHIIGAQGQALDASKYLEYFKKRVYVGLGISELLMGDSGSVSAGASETMTSQLHGRVKAFQKDLAHYLTDYILVELLLEGGFDPINIPQDRVRWLWYEIELDSQIKKDNHWADMYTKGTISFNELRRKIKMKPLLPGEEKDMYLNKVQIPLALVGGSQAAGGAADSNRVDDNRDMPSNQYGKMLSPKVSEALDRLVQGIASQPDRVQAVISEGFTELSSLVNNSSKKSELSTLLTEISVGLSKSPHNASAVYGRFGALSHRFQRIFEE